MRSTFCTGQGRLRAAFLFVLALNALPFSGHAQDPASFPRKTVTLVVAGAPGTGADILARTLAARLTERWKVAVVTDNRVGAAGTIGNEYVARSAPDGHTLLFVPSSFATSPSLHAHLPYDPLASFAPVSLLATGALAVVVNAQVPARSLRDLIELARSRPGQLNYASPGPGSPQHLAFELIKQETGVDIVHVPYKASGAVIAGLLAGQVQATVAALQTAGPQVATGKLRLLGVMSAERASAYPSLPTVREQGFNGLEVETWYGAFAPAATPAALVARISRDLAEEVRQPALREALGKQGLEPVGGPPERFTKLVHEEIARWKRVVAAAGIRAE